MRSSLVVIRNSRFRCIPPAIALGLSLWLGRSVGELPVVAGKLVMVASRPVVVGKLAVLPFARGGNSGSPDKNRSLG